MQASDHPLYTAHQVICMQASDHPLYLLRQTHITPTSHTHIDPQPHTQTLIQLHKHRPMYYKDTACTPTKEGNEKV